MQEVSAHPQSAPTATLEALFADVNGRHFDGFLDMPELRWNTRLRTSAGRFVPGSRKYFRSYPAVIEVASYLLTENNGESLVRDTLAHEMIHYWLWVRRKPYGHTDAFYSKMTAMGVSRYNPVPHKRPYKYLYLCDFCGKEFFARRKLGPLACAICCKTFSEGRYDERFKLVLTKVLQTPSATPEASPPSTQPGA